ncbi:MAG: TetR/AcrR family transcriptional regulator [Myxococcota bacterium]
MQATARILLEEGYDKLSTNRIAKAAGVSVGSLYQYFPNKQALVMALAERHNREMMDSLALHVTTLVSAPIPEAVQAYVHTSVQHHSHEPELGRALTVQMLSLGLDLIEDSNTRARPLIRAWLSAHAHEIIPKNLDMAAWMLVHLVEAAVHGALLEDAAMLKDPDFESELCAMVVRYLVGSSEG